MKILVLGGNGQLGTEISKSLSKISNLTSLSRDQLDITDKNEVKKYIKYICPDIIINCAAYTKVDEAENNKEIAYKINSTAITISNFKS